MLVRQVWNYIYMADAPRPVSSAIPEELLTRMRREFTFWCAPLANSCVGSRASGRLLHADVLCCAACGLCCVAAVGHNCWQSLAA